jgi:hypothetical protein
MPPALSDNGKLSVVSLLFGIALLPAGVSAAATSARQAAAKTASLTTLIETQLPRWDRNHDGNLDLPEINRQIEDPSVRGLEASVLVMLFRYPLERGQGERTSLGGEELRTSARDPKFQGYVESGAKKLETMERALFLPSDPDISSFRQGRVGDCYLLAPIAAAVHLSPKGIRSMIRPTKSGGYEVTFGNGQRIDVPALTDGELLLGSRVDDSHGIWLSVLEKAFGIIRVSERAKKSGASADLGEIVPQEALSSGKTSQIITLLTGRQTSIAHHEPTSRYKGLSDEQLDALLVQLMQSHRLVCTATPREGKRPPGIAGHHAYAIVGYDSSHRQLTIFNPHGQAFKPKGEPGLANGYPTTHGQFNVPMKEFRTIFGSIVYETTKTAAKTGSATAPSAGRTKK